MTDAGRMNACLGSRDLLRRAADAADELGRHLFRVGTGLRRADAVYERQLRDEMRAGIPDAAAALALLDRVGHAPL